MLLRILLLCAVSVIDLLVVTFNTALHWLSLAQTATHQRIRVRAMAAAAAAAQAGTQSHCNSHKLYYLES